MKSPQLHLSFEMTHKVVHVVTCNWYSGLLFPLSQRKVIEDMFIEIARTVAFNAVDKNAG